MLASMTNVVNARRAPRRRTSEGVCFRPFVSFRKSAANFSKAAASAIEATAQMGGGAAGAGRCRIGIRAGVT
jgi:hypothetical protein